MKRTAFLMLLVLLFLAGTARAQEYRIDKRNEKAFQNLLDHLLSAYERPSARDAGRIEADLSAIRRVSGSDFAVAKSIADHWQGVYLNPEYSLTLHPEGEQIASELIAAGIPDSGTHAFVILGYALKNGKMTEELKARCEAGAAAARAFPNAILVCSGGATGGNNPEKHTEAGEMKAYLSGECGISADRIFVDEEAMTTLENAVNTFAILRERGVRTITIVTSSYHQRWGQALYNAMAALCKQQYGDEITIVGDYSFDTEPTNKQYRRDARIATQQLASMLGLPKR